MWQSLQMAQLELGIQYTVRTSASVEYAVYAGHQSFYIGDELHFDIESVWLEIER
jgi:hypothetical protein